MTWRSAFLIVLGAILLFAPIASGGQRTITWDPVTTYTDNTVIEASNLPVRYGVWYIDNVTGTRVNVAADVTTTSATFNDASMVKGRWYIFYGNAKVQDNTTSADSAGYSWRRPFQVPKHPDNHNAN